MQYEFECITAGSVVSAAESWGDFVECFAAWAPFQLQVVDSEHFVACYQMHPVAESASYPQHWLLPC